MKAAQLEPDPAAIVVRTVANLFRQRILIPVGDERGDAVSASGAAIKRQVGNKPVSGQQVEAETAHPAPYVERSLIQHDPPRQQRIGEGWERIKVRHVAIVGGEIVAASLARADM